MFQSIRWLTNKINFIKSLNSEIIVGIFKGRLAPPITKAVNGEIRIQYENSGTRDQK